MDRDSNNLWFTALRMRSAESRPQIGNRRTRPAGLAVRIRIGFFLLLLTGYPVHAEDPLLKPFSATFSVHRNIVPLGELHLELNFLDAGGYSYTAHTIPGFLAGLFSRNEVLEESRGKLYPDWVQPNRYRYQDQEESSENMEVTFDWNDHVADTSSHDITWSQPIFSGTQDKLSQHLQVRRHLAQGEMHIDYQVADGGKLKTYQFMVDGEEPIETPYGTFDCLRVKRRKESGPPDYTIWFAPKLDFFPVRIERIQGDRIYHMVLQTLESQPESLQ
jgi:hypothetical protein